MCVSSSVACSPSTAFIQQTIRTPPLTPSSLTIQITNMHPNKGPFPLAELMMGVGVMLLARWQATPVGPREIPPTSNDVEEKRAGVEYCLKYDVRYEPGVLPPRQTVGMKTAVWCKVCCDLRLFMEPSSIIATLETLLQLLFQSIRLNSIIYHMFQWKEEPDSSKQSTIFIDA